MASIVIPAHNEGTRITRCLESLLEHAEPGEFEVIVACNGCSDNTVAVANSFAHPAATVQVIEVQEASKPAALNAGLDVASRTICIFLDADVQLSTSGARALREALERPGVLAASTCVEVAMHDASALSRSYHRYWSKLPSVRHGLAGRGVYALSPQGLARLGTFPAIVADDRYIDLLFSHDERVVLPNISSVVDAALTATELVRRKTRVFAGNIEVEAQVPAQQFGSWRDVIRDDPRAIKDLPAYVGINLVAKLKARAMIAQGTIGWNRDEGSRR